MNGQALEMIHEDLEAHIICEYDIPSWCWRIVIRDRWIKLCQQKSSLQFSKESKLNKNGIPSILFYLMLMYRTVLFQLNKVKDYITW